MKNSFYLGFVEWLQSISGNNKNVKRLHPHLCMRNNLKWQLKWKVSLTRDRMWVWRKPYHLSHPKLFAYTPIVSAEMSVFKSNSLKNMRLDMFYSWITSVSLQTFLIKPNLFAPESKDKHSIQLFRTPFEVSGLVPFYLKGSSVCKLIQHALYDVEWGTGATVCQEEPDMQHY